MMDLYLDKRDVVPWDDAIKAGLIRELTGGTPSPSASAATFTTVVSFFLFLRALALDDSYGAASQDASREGVLTLLADADVGT